MKRGQNSIHQSLDLLHAVSTQDALVKVGKIEKGVRTFPRKSLGRRHLSRSSGLQSTMGLQTSGSGKWPSALRWPLAASLCNSSQQVESGPQWSVSFEGITFTLGEGALAHQLLLLFQWLTSPIKLLFVYPSKTSSVLQQTFQDNQYGSSHWDHWDSILNNFTYLSLNPSSVTQDE